MSRVQGVGWNKSKSRTWVKTWSKSILQKMGMSLFWLLILKWSQVGQSEFWQLKSSGVGRVSFDQRTSAGHSCSHRWSCTHAHKDNTGLSEFSKENMKLRGECGGIGGWYDQNTWMKFSNKDLKTKPFRQYPMSANTRNWPQPVTPDQPGLSGESDSCHLWQTICNIFLSGWYQEESVGIQYFILTW